MIGYFEFRGTSPSKISYHATSASYKASIAWPDQLHASRLSTNITAGAYNWSLRKSISGWRVIGLATRDYYKAGMRGKTWSVDYMSYIK